MDDMVGSYRHNKVSLFGIYYDKQPPNCNTSWINTELNNMANISQIQYSNLFLNDTLLNLDLNCKVYFWWSITLVEVPGNGLVMSMWQAIICNKDALPSTNELLAQVSVISIYGTWTYNNHTKTKHNNVGIIILWTYCVGSISLHGVILPCFNDFMVMPLMCISGAYLTGNCTFITIRGWPSHVYGLTASITGNARERQKEFGHTRV